MTAKWPGAACAAAVCFSASPAHAAYGNLFNVEGESAGSAALLTYDTRLDMLTDSNRVSGFVADGNNPFGANIVGTGAGILPIVGGVPEPSTALLMLLALALTRLRPPTRARAAGLSRPF